MSENEKPEYANAVLSFKLLVQQTTEEKSLEALLQTLDESYEAFDGDVSECLDTTIHISFPSVSEMDSVVIAGLDRAELLSLLTLGYQLVEEVIYKEK